VETHLTEAGLVPVDQAAQELGIDPRRFLGYCLRNKVGDPISDGREVYGWSCKTLAERLAVHSDGAT
jgi:ribosome-binding protein aMBF1 (putative translation factor)